MQTLRSICVYCGSADGLKQVYLDAANALGGLLAREGITLIYGAGKTGLMGAVADGALQSGGEVIGVVPHNLNTPVLIHANLTRLEITEDMHTRKARMSQLADAFITLPGGFGTFDELFETLTWVQIGLHSKPIGLLNVQHYFDPLLELIEHAGREGFLYSEHRNLLLHAAQPLELLDGLRKYQPPKDLDRWVNRPED